MNDVIITAFRDETSPSLYGSLESFILYPKYKNWVRKFRIFYQFEIIPLELLTLVRLLLGRAPQAFVVDDEHVKLQKMLADWTNSDTCSKNYGCRVWSRRWSHCYHCRYPLFWSMWRTIDDEMSLKFCSRSNLVFLKKGLTRIQSLFKCC